MKKYERALMNYFKLVSNTNKNFSKKLLKIVNETIKDSIKRNSSYAFLYGETIAEVAKETNADLSKYFYEGDLDVFELEIAMDKKGNVLSVTVEDAPRHTTQLFKVKRV